MPFKRRMRRKSKFVTKRSLPFQLMKFAETKIDSFTNTNKILVANPPTFVDNVELMYSIARGTGADDRIGNIVQASGYYIRCTFAANGTGNQNVMQYFRIIVYQHKIPASTDIPAVGMTDTPDPRRFIIWHDKTMPCSFVPGGGNGVVTLKKKFKPYLKMEWDSSVLTDITKGDLSVMFLAKNDAAVTVDYTVRLYFKDV